MHPRTPFAAALLLGLSVVVLPATLASAQTGQDIWIPDAPSCSNCLIESRVLATLSSDTPDGEISSLPTSLRIDPRGNYWMLSEGTLPRVYDASGRFLRSFGRLGQGPGELLSAQDLFWPTRDTLVVWDGDNGRAAVFANDTQYVRQSRVQGMVGRSLVLDWPQRVLVTGEIRASGAESRWLHVVDLSGADTRVQQSIGPAVAWRGIGSPLQHFDTSASGLLVATGNAPYVIRRWRANGALHSSLRRQASWFPDSATGRIGTPRIAPSPAITALDVSNDGLVWVFLRMPSTRWRESWPELAPGQREVMTRQIDFGVMFNTRVEVIDPVQHRVLARRDLPGYTIASLGGGRVAMYTTDADGTPTVSIHELRIRR